MAWTGWPHWSKNSFASIPTPGRCSFLGQSAPTYRHSTYALRHDTIAYRWHPLFGMELQVAPFRRGKQLKQLITDQLPGYSREAPLWMFDAEYCGGMTLGSPEASIDSLTELAKLLAALRTTRKHRASSPPSESKEKQRAIKPIPEQISVQTGVHPTSAEAIGRQASKGCGGSAGRSPARGCRSDRGQRRRG